MWHRGSLLVCLGLVSALAPASAQVSRRAITASSLATTFSSKGLFRGTVEVHAESIVVVLDASYVEQDEDQPGRSAYYLDSLSVGLATTTAGDNWRVYSNAPAHVIADTLAERSRFSLGRLRFRVARVPDTPLDESWVTVTLYGILSPRHMPRNRQGTGLTYAHSDRRIFAGQ